MKNLNPKSLPAILFYVYIATLSILTLLWGTGAISEKWSLWMLPFLAIISLIMIPSGLIILAISFLIIPLPFAAVLQLFARISKWPILLLCIYIGVQIVLILLYLDGQIRSGTATLPWSLAWIILFLSGDIKEVKDPYGGVEPPQY
jgi:hypothetical protein